ncbi:flagellar hook-associated protein FlgK [Limnohabitans radicicola]|uniref:Flagellar hook-associated protein 1 n=1 Tax=Limnohabitans radicicola TaxID=2771427 RepID=A0A927IJU4_9BURK|nr:flagellar hook-associated protein FlgK [Limnohabitans radicicola]MBD8048953.1 flagellar hook-associated protein FlgK [Limnohabitans radicicola]
MSDLLGIGSSGVTAYQRALATVSNNIANVSTDGYSRQDVNITANEPSREGISYVGNGSRFDQVRRQYDAFVETNLRNSNSDLAAQKPLLTYVNRLIDVMGDQSIGLTSAMNEFFKAAGDLATDPASTISRSSFLQNADGLAARFRQLDSQLQILDSETRQALETDAGQINAYTQQLSALNKQLSKNGDAEKQPSELLDQRDLLLKKLSELVTIKTSFSNNGEVLVTLGDTNSQGFLVKGATSRDVVLQASDQGELQINYRYPPVDAVSGKKLALPPISSGKIGGTLAFREQVLQPAQNSLDNLARVMTTEINRIHTSGIDAEGKLGGDLFGFAPEAQGKAAGIQVIIQDTNRVAAAGHFRIIDDPLNGGTAQARIGFTAPVYTGPTGLVDDLANGNRPAIGRLSLSVGGNQPYNSVGLIPVGQTDVEIHLDQPLAGQSLQVFTRDGRQLLGQPLADGSMVKTANGMESGATYSTQYLNKSGDDTYLGMDIFMGAKASPMAIQQFSVQTGDAIEPQMRAAVLTGSTFNPSLTLPIAAGDYTLNGVALGALPHGSSTSLTAMVNWLRSANVTGITVTADTANNRIVMTRTDTTGDIRLGLGNGGSAAELKKMGFDTAVSIQGAAADDLLVFVSDSSNSARTASISSQFGATQGDMKQTLRSESFQILFSTDTHYQIIDNKTQTILAERDLTYDPANPTPSISYRGLKMDFSTYPKQGDKFTIDGNTDGIGNNETMMGLVNLENQNVMPGGLTMTEAYIEQVNKLGNVSRQATIAQQALTVVFNQAKETRDSVSGVSLDQEASDLVRYQQAYQANAKVMQVASQLFDSILQVR